jgi:hypothetical protein
MNISTGISEINFPAGSTASQKAGKAYIWPVYNSGAIAGIQKVDRETASDIGYIRPYSADLNDPSALRHGEYSSNGRAQSRPSSYYPGYFLNILA